MSIMPEIISKSDLKYCAESILEVKERDDGLIVKGYIATSHEDYGKDRITPRTLKKWADEINSKDTTKKVSWHHMLNDPRAVGVGIKGTARVDKLPDGEYGLWVETLINKTHPDYKDIKYEIENNIADSYSIEYIHPSGLKQDYGELRVLGTETELMGWTIASRPMNQYAVMVKTLIKEGNKMVEDSEILKKSAELEAKEMKLKELQDELEKKTAQVVEIEKKQKQEIEAKELAKKQADIEQKTQEMIKSKVESLLESKEVSDKIDSLVQKKGVVNMESEDQPIEVKQYTEIFSNKRIDVKEQFRRAGQLISKLGLAKFGETKTRPATEKRDVFSIADNKIQYKGLSIGDNANASYVNATTGVGISQAELQDVIDPVIYNALNETTMLWDKLAKDNKSGNATNRIGFVLKVGQNTSAGFYEGNEVGLSNTPRLKYLTRFKKAQVGFSVDGDMIAASAGSPYGEILAEEIGDATIALKTVINKALFDTKGLETDKEVIGLPFITRSATYTTLYSTTRSAANKLAPDAAGDTYVSGASGLTKKLLRQVKRHCEIDGSNMNDLFFVGNPIQRDALLALYDNAQRLVPISTKFGFEGLPEFDGIPFFSDKDCPAGNVFLIDGKHHRVGMWVAPTVEMLGKRSDAEEGFVKTYFAVYNTAPRRMVEIHSLPTA